MQHSQTGRGRWSIVLLGWFIAASPELAAEQLPPLPIPVESLPANYRDAILDVIRDSTMTVQVGPEVFHSPAALYHWLLEHPDRVSRAWLRLGVPCLNITTRADGQHRWMGDEGTMVVWRRVAQSEHGLIWYAHGRANPGPLLPMVPGRAVAVLWYRHGLDDEGRPVVRHHLDLYMQTDGTAAGLIARVLGATAPDLAQEAAGQLLYFFSGVARHLDARPEETQQLLAP